MVVALSAAALLGYGYEKAGSFPRVSLDGSLAPVDQVEGQPLNVLLVGTDSSAGLDPDDPLHIGRPSTTQADAIMILRLEPGTNDAALLSIPRDLWVPIAGTDQSAKITSAYEVGGARTLIDTIDAHFGIPINHFVAVDFNGFQQVVSAIGGVQVYFPHPARDAGSGLSVPEAGCQLLDPDQALAYSRSRRFEALIDGEWVPDNQSDFGRMRRQQDFMRAAMGRAIERGARNPATLNQLLNAVEDDVVLDQQITTGQMIDIAVAFRLFNPESLGSYSLQPYVFDQRIQGQDALVLRSAEADPLLDLFRGTVGLAPTPETVRLTVRNGSGTRNEASEVATALRSAGFLVPGTTNFAGEPRERTEIRFYPGQRAAAELLAAYLAVPPRLVEDRLLTAVPIELVTGTDYRGLVEPGEVPESVSTSTTTASITTTTAAPTTASAPTSDVDASAARPDLPPPC